jgi:hypothetical protein
MTHDAWLACIGNRDGYAVVFEGELLLTSTGPECDAARALVAIGVTGKLILRRKSGYR